MGFILTVYFTDIIHEITLSGVNNRAFTVDIPTALSGYAKDFKLSFEVWDNHWIFKQNDEVSFLSKIPVTEMALPEDARGMEIVCVYAPQQLIFTVIADAVYPGYAEFDKYALSREQITVGSADGCTIQYNIMNRVNECHAILRPQNNGYSVTDNSSVNGTYVNGKRITGEVPLFFGDTIYIMKLKLVYLDTALAVNRPLSVPVSCALPPFENVSDTDSTSGLSGLPGTDDFYQCSPPNIEWPDDETIEIDPPPAPGNQRKQSIWMTVGPSLTMVLPMAIGMMFMLYSANNAGGSTNPMMFMGIITSAVSAVIGCFWGVLNYIGNKRTERETEKRRTELYGRYLEKTRLMLEEKHRLNRDLLRRRYPDASECLTYLQTDNRRLWERNINHPDFLTVRLALGHMPSPNAVNVPKERFSLIDDNLAEEPRKIASDYRRLREIPVLAPLKTQRLLGVLGSDENLLSVARAMALQLAVFHAYSDVKLVFIYPERLAAGYAFAKWLPHTWNADGSFRAIASDANSVGEILYQLSVVIRERLTAATENEHKQPLPHYVVFIADPSLVDGEAAMKYLCEPTEAMGVSVVMLYGQIDRLPNSCTVLLRNDDQRGLYSLDNQFKPFTDIVYDPVDPAKLDQFCRALSGVKLHVTQSGGEIPHYLPYLGMFKTTRTDTLDINRNWLENRAYESIRALIGFGASGAPVYLDIHEKYHGPHGLVAGTTGSGKSELLQTYILSLALNFHPYEVAFILIDYKGGGMAGSFEKLPHICGIITNLGGNQTRRALLSIRCEIDNRQRLFYEHKVKHIDEYIELFRAGKTTIPLPHLLIIVDEFAELKKEQPEFIRELVSASRIGRSLGVHLILATQKPDGQVDDEIWGNSKFRMCLRVQSKQDSVVMIKHPDAAMISNPGRAYIQVGNDEIFELFQSGFAGAPYEPDTDYSDDRQNTLMMITNLGRRRVVGVSKKKTQSRDAEKPPSQLEVLVQYVSDYFTVRGDAPLSALWKPPLAAVVTMGQMDSFAQTRFVNGRWPEPCTLKACVGFADDPLRQRQIPLSIDLMAEGHIAVYGSGLSGKTTFLKTFLYALLNACPPSRLHVYIADFGSRTMGVFDSAPQVGGVAYDSDTDKVDKLTGLLIKELNARKMRFSAEGFASYSDYIRRGRSAPAIVLAVDNFGALREYCPQTEDSLIKLSNEGASYGIYMVVTCTNQNDLPIRLRRNINLSIGLQLASRYEYEDTIGAKTDILPDERTPGRGLICVPLPGDAPNDKPVPVEFQTALITHEPDADSASDDMKQLFAQMQAAAGNEAATPIPQVPSDMSINNLLTVDAFARMAESTRYLPLGYDRDEAAPVCADLADIFCFTISGTARSGKTNMLKVLMKLARMKNARLFVFDGPGRALNDCATKLDAEGYMTGAEDLFAFTRDVLQPEFTSRNARKAALISNPDADMDVYLQSAPMIFLGIGDMTAFCAAVYNSERNMKDFIEIMTEKGDKHLIYLAACIGASDTAGDFGTKRFLRGFTGWKTGLHLGGETDTQRALSSLDVPFLERNKKLPAGCGHVVTPGGTKRIITPLYS